MSEGNPLARHGAVSYLEIPAADARRSAAFYERVLGWRVDDRGGGDFRFDGGDGRVIGRWVTERGAGRDAGVVPFIYVDGIDAVVARVADAGGEVVRAVYAEGDVRVARLRDPAGNLIGVWEFGR